MIKIIVAQREVVFRLTIGRSMSSPSTRAHDQHSVASQNIIGRGLDFEKYLDLVTRTRGINAARLRHGVRVWSPLPPDKAAEFPRHPPGEGIKMLRTRDIKGISKLTLKELIL